MQTYLSNVMGEVENCDLMSFEGIMTQVFIGVISFASLYSCVISKKSSGKTKEETEDILLGRKQANHFKRDGPFL